MRWLVILALLIGCKHTFDPIEARDIRGTAVVVGAPAPEAHVVLPSGSKIALADLLHDKTIVVFYRGFY